jgi:DNA-binding beta-propeller fold protein YncE
MEMRKLALLSTLLVAPLAVAASVALSAEPRTLTGVSGTVYAVERLDNSTNTLAAFDAGTGVVLGIAVVGNRPIGVLSPNGSDKVYSADERSNQLSVVSKSDLADDGTATAKRIPMGIFPHHMASGPSGRWLYVAEYGSHKIGVVDTRLDVRVDGFFASGNPAARTHAVWVTNDGKDLYATNEGATTSSFGTLSKLDASTGRRLWEVPIGIRPSEVLVTPDGKTAYVTVRNENSVRVLDVSGERPARIADVAIGTQPDTMRLTHDGRTLVVGLRGTPQLALMSTDTRAVRQVTFQGYGISGHQWLSENGTYTFIALESLTTDRPGAIGVVDNGTAQVVETWTYPRGPWPHGVYYEPRTLR